MYRLQPNISLCLADIDFHLQGVVKEASNSYIPPLLSLQRLLWKELQEHTHKGELREITTFEGCRKYCQIC